MNECKSYNDSVPDDAAATAPCSSLLEKCTGSVEIYGVSRSVIIDTDSNISILQPPVSSSAVRITLTKQHALAGEFLVVKGLQMITFWLNMRECTHTFLVCILPTEAAGSTGH